MSIYSLGLDAQSDGVGFAVKPTQIATPHARMFVLDVPLNSTASVPVDVFQGLLCIIAIEASGCVELQIGTNKLTLENGVSIFSLVIPSGVTSISFKDVASNSPTVKISITSYSLSSTGAFE